MNKSLKEEIENSLKKSAEEILNGHHKTAALKTARAIKSYVKQVVKKFKKEIKKASKKSATVKKKAPAKKKPAKVQKVKGK